ncbi:ABC transporter permease [Brevibacterium sp. 91QC2O2]|jgi:peptide/nickel transport system permease protein|uniref:ABC transporter permease n=1 Tax=Brevibacterium TaxID=1696 RepID=UPI00211B8143|nr:MULTISPECIES: ABC transporter permease [unclassified Brevibacterium]MCQ9368873.1 ABC transporter permease [Brevibacterium sp. 91QC2O2]MCQ9386628.1 ABC transporter permease [Brevibacterium sp. 68QC2CO]
MIRFIATKVLQSLITFIISAVLIFAGVRALPGDPALVMAGEDATPDQLAQIRADLGLDQPMVIQFFHFMGNIFTGDLGTSTRTGQTVVHMISTTLPVTLWLAAYAVIVAVVVGIALGMIAERFRGRWPEGVANVAALLGLSIPNFWLGLLAILLLAVTLNWFPASGYVAMTENPLKCIYYLTLPAVILGVTLAAVVTRQTRASMIETMSTDYVRTARAKGLHPARILFRYGLRNSLTVLVTIIGLQLGGLISGAVVTERIFALPGIGKLTLDAVFSRDYPVIQAVVLVITIFYIVINLAVDLLYSVINPQIRVGGGR